MERRGTAFRTQADNEMKDVVISQMVLKLWGGT
jgi:hypothetical protein